MNEKNKWIGGCSWGDERCRSKRAPTLRRLRH